VGKVAVADLEALRRIDELEVEAIMVEVSDHSGSIALAEALSPRPDRRRGNPVGTSTRRPG
jgi:hypothetical protein